MSKLGTLAKIITFKDLMKLITGSPQLHSFVMTTTQSSLRVEGVAIQWIISFLIVFLSISVCVCKESAPKNLANDIQIKADNMQYSTSRNHADANGNAILSYIVNDSLVTLKADDLHADFDEHGNLTSAVAEGHVEIEYKDTKLLATKCTHNFNANAAVCTGEDVQLLQNKDELHGRKATLDIQTHVFTMQADPQEQVTCVVYPKKKEDKK